VAVYVASLALPCVRTLGHIAAAHVVAVLRLPALAREPLLHEASRDRLSVRELRQRVVGMRRAEGERRGRPARGSSHRVITEVEALAKRLLTAVSMLPAPKDLEPDARERVGAVAAELLKVGGELRRQTSGGPTVAGAGKPRPFEPREQAAVGAE
jgi:hypothetical protein